MYEILIKEYIKRLSLKDINDFAIKKGIKLLDNEDKKIYNLIIKYWKDIYNGNTNEAFTKLKNEVSEDTYNNIINLYNEYKKRLDN